MSEEQTQDIAQRYDTKPTIETVLERLNALGAQFNARVDELEEHLAIRLDRIETQVDRVASAAYETRADVRELKGQLKEHFPFVK